MRLVGLTEHERRWTHPDVSWYLGGETALTDKLGRKALASAMVRDYPARWTDVKLLARLSAAKLARMYAEADRDARAAARRERVAVVA
jgi:hypothetical protein